MTDAERLAKITQQDRQLNTWAISLASRRR